MERKSLDLIGETCKLSGLALHWSFLSCLRFDFSLCHCVVSVE